MIAGGLAPAAAGLFSDDDLIKFLGLVMGAMLLYTGGITITDRLNTVQKRKRGEQNANEILGEFPFCSWLLSAKPIEAQK